MHVLRRGNIDLLGYLWILVETIGLRIDAEPVPGIGCVFVRRSSRPEGGAEREIFTHFGAGRIRVAEHEWLPFPTEPKFIVTARSIEFFQQLFGGIAHVRIQHKKKLRNPSAFSTDLQHHRQELTEDIFVNLGIRGVEDQGIDPSIGEHVHVTPDDPGIGQFVVAEEGFTPVGIVPFFRTRMPKRRSRPHVRLVGKYFGDIVRAIAEFIACPGEIENSDKPVFFGRSDFCGQGQFTTQGIRRRPRYTGVDSHNLGNSLAIPRCRVESHKQPNKAVAHHKFL